MCSRVGPGRHDLMANPVELAAGGVVAAGKGVYNFFFGSSTTTVKVANDCREDIYAKVDREKIYIKEVKVSGGVKGGQASGSVTAEWHKVNPGFVLIKYGYVVAFEFAASDGIQVYISAVVKKSGDLLADNLPKVSPCSVVINKDEQLVDEVKYQAKMAHARLFLLSETVRVGF